MRYSQIVLAALGLWLGMTVSAAPAAQGDFADLERQFQQLPIEARRLTGPLFWLHGDDSPERLEMYVGKVAEGGNGSFTAESRPHPDWLGPGWWRDLAICLDAAKKNTLQMWIFDEKFWPSQAVAGRVPPRYAAKRLAAAALDVIGPSRFTAQGYSGPQYIAAVAGRVVADGTIDGRSLIDLAPFIRGGKLAWRVPAGRWKVMKFSCEQASPLLQSGQLAVDGASKDCVDWFLQTVYQPHYDHFKADFGKTIRGFFFDEPETPGDWGTELNATLAEWKVDWKKAYVAYKFGLAGEEQIAAKYQYVDALAETWGRTMYGGMTGWCEKHGVKSIGHFMEHARLYVRPEFCAGDMMRLQKYASMGAIDAVFSQFAIGRRVAYDPPTWQTPKIASSVSHVFGKQDDVTMVEIFGARGQDLAYSEMKWWADHMQVSGVNFMIPHSFNPRSPYDTDCPPYFYNGGFEPRWPLYRVWANYVSRLTLMLTGGRHVCPVAILFGGNTLRVGKAVTPEDMTSALQDAQFDSDWLPFEAFESQASIGEKMVKLHGERYRVLVVPPVEVIPYGSLAKAKQFFDAGGMVVGYGFLPSKSATIGRTSADISRLCRGIWGDDAKARDFRGAKGDDAAAVTACKTNASGGRSYLLSQTPTPEEVAKALADAGVHPSLEVLEGRTDGWLHVLHRVKDGRDVMFVANQNHLGAARTFKFRATAAGEPELWDPMRKEITAIPFQRIGEQQVEFSLTMEPLETALLVFQPTKTARPMRIEAGMRTAREPIAVVRDPNPPTKPLVPEPKGRPVTLSPLKAADPFRGRVTIPADIDLAHCRVCLEMKGLPDDSAAVKVNGLYAGGVIGKPALLDVTRYLKTGENRVEIEPLAPKSATIVFYDIPPPH
jgi:hypothetical protein